jgi:3-oxoacyl-[acyl-carrier-protein] synthase I
MTPVIVSAVGAATSIGDTLAATYAAVRGGINGFTFSHRLRDQKSGQPMRVAALPGIPDTTLIGDRMEALAAAAMREALAPLSPNALPDGLPALLSVPAERPGFDAEQSTKLAKNVFDGMPVPALRKRCGILRTGHEGGLGAVFFARDMILNGETPAVLVGGVDSYIEIETLHWIESTGRLKSEEAPNGFIPGEAAAFLLLCSSAFASEHGLPVMGEVLAASRAVEPLPWYSGKATQGQGLTGALRNALTFPDAPDRRAAMTYCDMNGESWRADEWGYAYLRTATNHADPLDMRHPADCWGDVGAASGPLLAALALLELGRREDSRPALVWTASGAGPWRAACTLAKTSLKRTA